VQSTKDPSTGTASELDPRFAQFRASGDHRVRNALVEDHRWLAQHCVRRFKRKGEPTEDLEQVAMVGLIKAIDRFDPHRGFAFATFAVPTILGELRRHFRDHSWSLRVPRRPKENYLAVKTAADDLHQELGRSPVIAELAERAGLSIEDTIEAFEAGSSFRGVPFDEPSDNDGPGEDGRQFGAADPGYVRVEAHLVVPGLLAALPTARERRIVELRFVHDMSQSRIAAELGISQVHVSRLLRMSLNIMRDRLER
jgi:RNA polymerase sigma-B factor